jgi:hypothetical protein
MKDNNLKRVPLKDIKMSGYFWPAFSADFKDTWHRGIQSLLRGNSAGEIFQGVLNPDPFRSDIHFWKEMQTWAAMAKAYADLGGDADKGLATALLHAADDNDKDKKTYDALRAAMVAPEILALTDAALADMRTQVGAEPWEWAKEQYVAKFGQEAAKEFYAKFGATYKYQNSNSTQF